MKILAGIQVLLLLALILFIGGCGGSSGTAAPSKVVSKSSLLGVTPDVFAIDVTIALPAGVTVKADANGETLPGVVTLLAPNNSSGNLLATKFTPATGSVPAILKIGIIRGGATFLPGDFFNISCDVASGTSVTAASFGSPTVLATDANGVEIAATASIEVGGTTSGTGTSTGTGISVQTALQSGFYEFRYSEFSSASTTLEAYAISNVSLGADGFSLAETREYFDPANNQWSTTLPSGIPTTAFGMGTEYFLTPSGWVPGTSGASGFTIAFNADGSAIITNKTDASKAQLSIVSQDISGQSWDIALSLSEAFLFPHPLTAPALPLGSTLYSMTFIQQTESYVARDDSTSTPVSLLADVPIVFADDGFSDFFSIRSNKMDNFFFGAFASNTLVNIYQPGLSPPYMPILIGSAPCSIKTVNSQEVLMVEIPATMRSAYKMGGNPFFAVIAGSVKQGEYSLPGQVSFSNGGVSFSKPVADYVKANFDPTLGLAKSAVSKSLFRQLPRF